MPRPPRGQHPPSQPGAVRNTLSVGTNAALKIEVSGENAGVVFLFRIDGTNSTLTGLVINRAVAVALLVSDHPTSAGVLLAMATIKPQHVWLLLWLTIWTVSD